jgi:hypothetical protein
LVRLGPELPEFFRQGGEIISEVAVDPDLMRNRDLPTLRAAEGPEHYLDRELLPRGEVLPESRWDLIAQQEAEGRSAQFVGYVPYAVIESAERLAMTFAQYRQRPGSEAVKAKALVYAGLLAHYAGDLCQPLHTSIHHDGRARADLSSPHTGIHRKVDGLFRPEVIGKDESGSGKAVAYADLLAAVREQFEASHALVDAVYELEPKLEAVDAGVVDPQVRAFAAERYRTTKEFIAALFTTAWELSERVEVPDWGLPQTEPENGACAGSAGQWRW